VGAITTDQKVYLAHARRAIIRMMRDNGEYVNKALAIYDSPFAVLVAHQLPKTLRDSLLSTP
jgi:hypothetical protein